MSPDRQPLPKLGDSLGEGRYVLTLLIGEGASAAVYEARDLHLDLPRAIKVLRASAGKSADQRRRLWSEARTLSELSHPNVLRMYDFSAHGPYDYVVMQLADGGSLGQKLREHGAMPPAEAVGYALQTLAALAHAHEHGVVHRDVKPQNILLDGADTALLADFGIALLTSDDTRATRTGVAMGTMAFMAPEQRLDARSVGPQADVYAVGSTLYNLLTNDNPVDLFAAAPDSSRWRGIPEVIVDVIRKATHYDPSDRYPSAGAMAAELMPAFEVLEALYPGGDPIVLEASAEAIRYLTEHPTAHTIASPASTPVAPPVPDRRPLWGLAALLALVLIGVCGLWGAGGVQSPATEPATMVSPTPVPPPTPKTEPVATAPSPVAEVPAPRPEPVATPPTIEPAPKPSPAAKFPFGTWRGQAGGRPFELELRGPAEELTGTMVSSFGRKQVTTEFRGSYHAPTGVLEWHDIGEFDDATDVSLTRDGDGFRGEFRTRRGAGRGPIYLVERLP